MVDVIADANMDAVQRRLMFDDEFVRYLSFQFFTIFFRIFNLLLYTNLTLLM